MNPMLFPGERGNPLLAAGEYINEAAGRRRAEREARREEIGNRLLQTWPAEAVRAAYEAVTLFGDVYAGRVDPMSDEGIGRTAELTGLLALQAPLTARQGALGIFGGRMAKTADLDALARAQSMADSGADRRAIWDATGWFRGPDGQWRFEIDDSGARVDEALPAGYEGRLGDIVDHRAFAEAYPDAPGMHATYGQIGGSSGAYGPVPGVADESIAMGAVNPKPTALHEMQHATQAREGFARGGSPADKGLIPLVRKMRDQAEADFLNLSAEMRAFQDAYLAERGVPRSSPDATRLYMEAAAAWRQQNPDRARRIEEAFNATQLRGPRSGYHILAGEVEARNVARRADMTAEERRARPPWETQDVPDDMQIVIRR